MKTKTKTKTKKTKNKKSFWEYLFNSLIWEFYEGNKKMILLFDNLNRR